MSDSESNGFKGSDNAAVAMGTAAWFCRDLSEFVLAFFGVCGENYHCLLVNEPMRDLHYVD